jgi:hypothetical protein
MEKKTHYFLVMVIEKRPTHESYGVFFRGVLINE